MLLELFRLALAGLIIWGFCWMISQCVPNPRPERFKRRRR